MPVVWWYICSIPPLYRMQTLSLSPRGSLWYHTDTAVSSSCSHSLYILVRRSLSRLARDRTTRGYPGTGGGGRHALDQGRGYQGLRGKGQGGYGDTSWDTEGGDTPTLLISIIPTTIWYGGHNKEENLMKNRISKTYRTNCTVIIMVQHPSCIYIYILNPVCPSFDSQEEEIYHLSP